MATTKRTYLAGNKNKCHTFTLYHNCRPNRRNYGIHPIHHKNLPYATAPNLSKLWQNYIAQLKARNLHKIIQAELTWDRRIRLDESNKANHEIIFWRNNMIRLIHIKFLHFASLPSP